MKEGVTVCDAERAALAYLNSVTLRPELQFNMLPEPGICSNQQPHSLSFRTDFVDSDEPDRKRLLFRLWLNLDDGAHCASDYADIGRRRLLEGYGSNGWRVELTSDVWLELLPVAGTAPRRSLTDYESQVR